MTPRSMVLRSLCLLLPLATVVAAATVVPSLVLVKSDSSTSFYVPLEKVEAVVAGAAAGCRLVIRDGEYRQYLAVPVGAAKVVFDVRGLLGVHLAVLADSAGATLAQQTFVVDVQTALRTGSRTYDQEFQKLQQEVGWGRHQVIDGQDMVQHISWLRDNYYAVKASKYWDTEITRFPGLFLDRQRKDGMVYDLLSRGATIDPFTGKPAKANVRAAMWGEQWVGWTRDSSRSFERMPVEADVEYLAVMHTYLSWQASGDDRWMTLALPRLEKAMAYAMSDPLRWSPELKLVKRAYSIDSWDYVWDEVARVHPTGNKNRLGGFDACFVDEQTPMGILHADNTGMFQACRQMAAMYRYTGDTARVQHWEALADSFRVNTVKTCWNGTFFTHYVHIDSFPVDTSVHEKDMLSYSNPHAINRGLTTQEQSASILREYQRRLVVNKDRAFAEWYTIDPPFPKGFGAVGEYMNGGITPIVAAELMKAAFDHGFEAYGADILKRVTDVHSRHARLSAVYRPLPPSRSWEKETFYPVNLRAAANRGFNGDMPHGGIGEGRNDLRSFPLGKRAFGGKEFVVLDPAANGGNGLIVVNASDDRDGTDSVKVTGINRAAKSIYFLNCVANAELRRPAAYIRVDYADSSSEMIELSPGRNTGSWWEGGESDGWKVVWRGSNPVTPTLTVGMSGWNNPHPEKTIKAVAFMASGKGTLMVPAMTLSSAKVQIDDNDVSSGIPDAWASGNMFWAVAEGLAGVTDNLALMRDVTIAPRWSAIKESSARVNLRYGASQGYVSYDYTYNKSAGTLAMRYSGTATMFRFHVLLPDGLVAKAVTANGRGLTFGAVTVEKSRYADFEVTESGGGSVSISLAQASK